MEYILYTVRGMREVYYAAVDWETGKVWTAPTKDVAIRMAREAGFEVYTEEVISKDELMRSMGFGRTLKLRRSDPDAKPKTALFTDHTPEPEEKPKEGTPAAWFVPAEGQVELGAAQRFPAVPRLSKSGKKSRKSGSKGSPFTASRPIAPGGGEGENDDDMLILPSSESPSAPKAIFSDEVPPVKDDSAEDL